MLEQVLMSQEPENKIKIERQVAAERYVLPSKAEERKAEAKSLAA
jgi:hypothetical protein